MPTYATAQQVTDELPGLVVDDAAGFATLIEQAERVIDDYVGPWRRREDTGLKIDPARDLYPWQAEVLARAVAYQVEYELAAPRVATPVPVTVKGPDFETSYDARGPRPDLAPRAGLELGRIRTGLVPTGARARA